MGFGVEGFEVRVQGLGDPVVDILRIMRWKSSFRIFSIPQRLASFWLFRPSYLGSRAEKESTGALQNEGSLLQEAFRAIWG